MKYIYITLAITALLFSCNRDNSEKYIVENSNYKISINNDFTFKIISSIGFNINSDNNFRSANIETADGIISDFKIADFKKEDISDSIGKGVKFIFVGNSKIKMVEKTLEFKTYIDFPELILINQSFKNLGETEIEVEGWKALSTSIKENNNEEFWSFNGSSSEERADWILPVKRGFYKKNYLGMNDSDYGGGIPISAVWRRDYGIAVGHTSLTPELVSLPIEFKKQNSFATLGVQKELIESLSLKKDEKINLLETFITYYKGDFFTSFDSFNRYMRKKGLKFVKPEISAFEPIWCAWGYERIFTAKEILQTLPKVKELGFKWAVIDDGFQIDEGNWNLNPKKFPKGNKEMKSIVDKIHSYGLKAKIWWTPLAVDMLSDVLRDNPDILLRNKNESPQYITWWDAFYMSPSSPITLKETDKAIKLFIEEWGFDGFKMDGQHMNAIPPDYNKSVADAEQAVRDLPDYFQYIYDEARALKKDAVIENCPCGCVMSYYNMATMNQAVSSDPESSWQIRTKGKVYKALIPEIAYYGDHVELSDNKNDFASSFGIGAVLGSKFTYPVENPDAEESFLLTPEKEKVFKKWISLYEQKRLSQEKYLGGLYDIGFDKPETHAILKGDTMYYAFYSKKWTGEVELRGLDKSKKYNINDYENNKELGVVNGDNPTIKLEFVDHLLIEVYPID